MFIIVLENNPGRGFLEFRISKLECCADILINTIIKIFSQVIKLFFRCKILREKKAEQLEELNRLQTDTTLMENGEELASKLEQAQENIATIADR